LLTSDKRLPKIPTNAAMTRSGMINGQRLV